MGILISEAALNDWSGSCAQALSRVRAMKEALSAGSAQEARDLAEGARAALLRLGRDLSAAGAVPPGNETAPADAIPLHLLTSAANQRWERSLRELLEALQDLEAERAVDPDRRLILESWLHEAHEEIHGPPGLGEGPAWE